MEIDTPVAPLPPNVYFASDAPEEKPAPNWLRMVCISDTHNMTDINNYPIPAADILVHGGDFTKMGTTAQIDQFICWMNALTHIPLKVIVAGNHEVLLDKDFYEKNWQRFHETKEDHQVAIEKILSAGRGTVYLNNSSFTVDGGKILHKKWQKEAKLTPTQTSLGTEGASSMAEGVVADPREGWKDGYKIWASPWQPEFFNWAFNETRGELKHIWKHIPGDTDILMTHGPPKGYGDIVPEDSKLHVGCEELLERLAVVKPLYHVFGHIHQGYGVSQIDWPPHPQQEGDQFASSTVCINASTCNVRYRPLNQPIIVDLPPK